MARDFIDGSQEDGTFKSAPYYDDYDASKGYERILFKPGVALQARELTQSQTIIQAQIERFGNNIFKEGAAVRGGELGVSSDWHYIKVTIDDVNVVFGQEEADDLIGTVLSVPTTDIKFEVKEVSLPENNDPLTLYGTWVGGEPNKLPDGNYSLESNTINFDFTSTGLDRGVSVRTFVAEGDFFAGGFFIQYPAQSKSKIISKYSSPTDLLTRFDVGFRIRRDIVEAGDPDTNLYDNASGTQNITAPGADRFRIKLELDVRTRWLADKTYFIGDIVEYNGNSFIANVSNSTDIPSTESPAWSIATTDNFILLGQVLGGEVISKVTFDENYNRINELLALRTSEESGDYIAEPFGIGFTPNEDSDKLNLEVEPGIAYIQGRRTRVKYKQTIAIDKARNKETGLKNNQVVPANFGNFIEISNTSGRLPDLNSLEELEIRANVQKIGTLRVRQVTQKPGSLTILRFYVFDVNIISGSSLSSADRLVGGGSTFYTNSPTRLQEPNPNNLLFKISDGNVIANDGVGEVEYTAQGFVKTSTNSAGVVTIDVPAGKTFTTTNNWFARYNNNSYPLTPVLNDPRRFKVVGINNSQAVDVVFYYTGTFTRRVKTLDNGTTTNPTSSTSVTLGHADIIEGSVSIDGDSRNVVLDNGQRDNFYGLGAVSLRSGAPIPQGAVITYEYYSHSSGDFFSVSSYHPAVENLEDIPSYTTRAGDTLDLADVLDFRSSVDTSGNFSSATVNKLPLDTDTIQLNVNYFYPRYATLLLNWSTGRLTYKFEDEDSFTPNYPDKVPQSIELYRIKLNPYTFDENDVEVEKVNNKLYRMADISDIENRVSRSEELISISLLETNTMNITILDDNDNDRTKLGILADNFINHVSSDIKSAEYRASIDPQKGYLTVPFKTDEIGLVIDRDTETTITNHLVKEGDSVMLPYEEVLYASQPKSSGDPESINPFGIINHIGTIELSPSSDYWVDTETLPARAINSQGQTIATAQDVNRNSWIWNWFGTQDGLGNLPVDQIIQKSNGSRQVNSVTVPYMRAIKISFKATGLRPNTTYIPFFDNVRIDQWVSDDYVRHSDRTREYGNDNYTEHPDGVNIMRSNIHGEITGSFFIQKGKFKTGERVFKLLDVDNEANAISSARTSFTASNGEEGVISSARTVFLSTGMRVSNQEEVVITTRPIPPTPTIDQGHSSNSRAERAAERPNQFNGGVERK